MACSRAESKPKFVLVTIVAAVFFFTAFGISNSTSAQSSNEGVASVEDRVSSHLRFGEFPAAIDLAKQQSAAEADKLLKKISLAQRQAGAPQAAYKTVELIQSDQQRYLSLANLIGGSGSGGAGSGAGTGGSGSNESANAAAAAGQGGITAADFTPLMNLIKSTIDPEGWDDTNGDGTIQAYPAGVYVDPSGTLHRMRTDSKSSLNLLKKKAKTDSGNRVARKSSQLRKVSLNRLEKQAQLLAAQGKPIGEVMQNLAGIYEISYLMFVPETNDIIIAGPAGNWQKDSEGRVVNASTEKPTLQMDDLVVCLRNVYSNNGKFGCAITPRQENLRDTKQFVSTSKLKGKAWRTKLRETLGKQDIEVFGVDPETHAGRVLVEADYRMKLVAMGLEDSIPEIPSYLSRIQLASGGGLPPMDVVRWWFTMNYKDVVADPEKEIFTFNGTGVKVLSENEMIDDQGARVHTGKSKGPTAGYARDFTDNFDKIADKYPVYRQLKNVFDLAIVSAIIRNQRLDKRAGWNMTYFGENESYSALNYRPRTSHAPDQVDSVMNHRVINERKKSSTLKHTLIGVSGGITFDSMKVVMANKMKTDDSGELASVMDSAKPLVEDVKWWWD